jgi:ATP-dependent DNA helicase RecG
LALSFLGFTQAYLLDEKPFGRQPVTTKVVPAGKEEVTYTWIAEKLAKGEQAYLVFPRIRQEDESDLQSLQAMEEALKEKYFIHTETGLLHGGMKETEKQKVMADFSSGKIRLLFSTTVIEVGVDVPNATIMAIHGAEMFGLAQLHQLRGRVGRSEQHGFCLLFPGKLTPDTQERLEFFSNHSSGIDVAEFDLKHRGTGTLLGNDQSGLSELRIATVNDLSLFQDAMDVYTELKQRHIAIEHIFRVKSEGD